MAPNWVIKLTLPVILTLLPVIPDVNICYSQDLVKNISSGEQIFLARTKQFTEFLDRFNYRTNFNGEKIDSSFKAKFPREKVIASLFDAKDPRTDKSGKQYSPAYDSDKEQFIRDVMSGNKQIYRYSENIVAEARSRILFNGVPKTISIYLTQEIVGKDMVKWVINSVRGDIFNFLRSDTTMVRFIPPSSNETDFINLKRALEDNNYLHYYSSKDFVPDYLTVFYYMINSGQIKFDYVEEVVYHITEIQGWYIKVKDFNRNEMNSGWLISDIKRNSSDRNTTIKNLK
jgi:hypothetical protein